MFNWGLPKESEDPKEVLLQCPRCGYEKTVPYSERNDHICKVCLKEKIVDMKLA